MSNLGDIENNELIKNDLIEQLDKYKRSRTSYLRKIPQNNKIINLITLDNQITTINECLYKVEKYLHKIKSVSQNMIELSTDENEIKNITLKVTEQEFGIIQIKKSIKNYKKENSDLSPKSSEVLSATSKSGSSKKETKNAENDIKSEADIKSNSNYSSTSASNTPYFNLQESELSPDYFKTLTEKTEINTTEKLKLLEQQYDAVKNIILSDAHDEYEKKQPFEFPKEFSELETKPNNNAIFDDFQAIPNFHIVQIHLFLIKFDVSL